LRRPCPQRREAGQPEANRAPRTMFDTLLENCIFYISQLYEFSHRLGQKRKAQNEQLIAFSTATTACIVYPPLTALRVHWGISRSVYPRAPHSVTALSTLRTPRAFVLLAAWLRKPRGD